METGGGCSISDWDRPFTDQELEAIDAIESEIKRRHFPTPNAYSDGDRPKVRRRLPGSIAAIHQHTGSGSESSLVSFSLLPCRKNRSFTPYDSSSPGKLMMKYPTMTFKGHIVYCKTFTEVDNAAKKLLKFVEARQRGMDQVILGFDIEWKPTFRRGVSPGKAAVMQICGDTSYCYVMHIIHSGIPPSLKSLLEDPSSVKVGVGIVNDAFKILNDYAISIKSLEDLSGLANQKLSGDSKKWSLASLTEMLICKQLPKPVKIRLGNWEADILSKEQIQYAATDAFASWYLYEALKSLPDTDNSADTADNRSELRNVPEQ